MLVKDPSRVLARIVTIDSFKPIPKSDFIELAVIGGWESIVGKGTYQPGSKVLLLEIDATLDYDAPILENFDKKRLKVIEDNNKKYVVIKTMRMRGELSQGLVISIDKYPDLMKLAPDTDVTDRLSVLKYVSKEEAKLYYASELEAQEARRGEKISWFRKLVWNTCAKLKKGIVTDGLLPFPSYLSKSEQPRAQNIGSTLMAAMQEGQAFEFTVKLDGESITYYTDPATYDVGITSRNYALRTKDVPYTFKEALRIYIADLLHYAVRKAAGAEVTFPGYKRSFKATDTPSVKLFLDSDIAYRIKLLNANLASGSPMFQSLRDCSISVQGECIGPDFHGGAERAKVNEFYAYTVYANGSRVVTPALARMIVEHLKLKYVPVVSASTKLPNTIKELMAIADGPGTFDPSIPREGIVGKATDSDISFKAISNKWLMRNDSVDTVEAA